MQAMDQGAIEGSLDQKAIQKWSIRSNGRSDWSGSKRWITEWGMNQGVRGVSRIKRRSDGCYQRWIREQATRRINRRSDGSGSNESSDGSGSKLWIRMMDQGVSYEAIEGLKDQKAINDWSDGWSWRRDGSKQVMNQGASDESGSKWWIMEQVINQVAIKWAMDIVSDGLGSKRWIMEQMMDQKASKLWSFWRTDGS